ncbi:MAG: PLP-dependent aminotransferase family protein [Anaerolineaceae bacterium]|nr:PLP-dependent aminotransferase family protein [Anaerolineaceae bacterium]
MQTPWEHRFAHRTEGMKSSFIRELLKVTDQPDMISFGGGFPAAEIFPIDRVRAACDKVLTEKGRKALQYTTTEGYAPLREWVARDAKKMGINISLDNILITTGSQQALDFVGRIFINRGDRVLTESPTYLGAIQAWNAYGPHYVTIDTDEDGMLTDQLEQLVATNIKFMYVLPNFQNPMGVTLSHTRRKQIVEIANRHGVPIVEDDPYGKLLFEGEPIPPLCVIDEEYHSNQDGCYSGNVIYTSTLSKILAPGLRIGWVIAPPQVNKKMVQAKQGADLQSSTFDQYVAYELVKDEWLNEHIELIKKVYKERRDAMLNAFEKYMPEGTTWTKPAGGLFLWLRLPDGCDTVKLFPMAVEEKVAYVPGEPFYPNGGPTNTMRMNFSASKPEVIDEGVRRLANIVRRCTMPAIRYPRTRE